MRVRRRAAAIAFIGLVFLGLPAGMLGIAWPSMRASLDAPFAGLGLLVAAMTVAQFASSAASGLLRERLGTIALLLASLAAAAGGLALFAIASGWWATILASAILGVGIGFLDAAVNTEAALRGDIRFMSGLHGAWAIGASLGPPLVGAALVASDSWRPAYVIAAAAFALLGVGIYAVRSDLSAAPQLEAEPPGARRIGRTVILGCALMFVYVGIEVGGGQWTYTRFTSDGTLSDGLAGLAVFLYWSALAAGRIALAVVGDRVAPARLFDLSVFGALGSTVGFSVLPSPIAALVALPLAAAVAATCFTQFARLGRGWAVLRRRRRRYGAYLAHLGLAVLVIGIAASHFWQQEKAVTLAPGQQVTVAGYTLTYAGSELRQLADHAEPAQAHGGLQSQPAFARFLPVPFGQRHASALH